MKRKADRMGKEMQRLLGLVVRMAGDDPMLFCLAVAHWARSQPQQTVESLVCALLERRLSEEVRREGDLQKGRLLAWMKAIAKARPDLFSKAGLQYVATLPLEHLLPFARFLAAAEGVDELMRELAGGERNGQRLFAPKELLANVSGDRILSAFSAVQWQRRSAASGCDAHMP